MAQSKKVSRQELLDNSEWQDIELVELVSQLTDKTPEEIREAVYNGPDDVKSDWDGE